MLLVLESLINGTLAQNTFSGGKNKNGVHKPMQNLHAYGRRCPINTFRTAIGPKRIMNVWLLLMS